MAQVTLDGDPIYDSGGFGTNRPTTASGPAGAGPLSGAQSAYGGHWDADAQQQYDYRRSIGQSDEDILKHTAEDYAARFPGGPSGGGGGSASRGVGGLFDDPASAQLQGIAQAQMGEVRSNPGLNDLMKFLEQQFTQLSTNPGFSQEELAGLHTQALEPIEQRRQASNTRAVERAGARGFLPTSGLTYLTDAPSGGVESLDTSYDRMRGTADRDLALAGVQQRRADLGTALQLGQLRGLDIPRSQRTEELALARVPYQMGRDSLSDLLAVLAASPGTGDLYNQGAQTAQRSYYEQQQEDERNSALLTEIGGLLSGLFKR